ncbi:ATP-binding protein [Vibrio rotiferianus]|uniref:ATP-binding protein n=1 Tax=Vibrio rotiferianus TaxID=190895 RepID=UPI0005EDB4EB|nr:transporter substrate-binding domain-containing protein [Vibrio rotiferianus]
MKIQSLLLIALSSITFAISAADLLSKEQQTYLKNNPSLKVGVLEGNWLPYWGDIRSKEGINIEYAETMTEELGITPEYVPFSNIQALFAALKANEIDLTVGFVATQARSADFLFSQPIFNTLRLIWLRDSSLKSKPLDELVWACVRNSSACDLARTQDYDKLHIVNNNEMLFQSLNTGIADAAIVGLSTLNSYGFQNVNGELVGEVIYDKSLSKGEVSIATNNSNPELMSIINKYIEHTKNTQNTHVEIEANINILHNDMMLKVLEKQEGRTAIRYTIEDDLYPLSYIDPQTGRLRGYVHDLLKLLAQRSLLSFEYIDPQGHDVEQMLKDGVVDLLPARNTNNIDRRDFIATQPYSELKFSYIRATQIKGKQTTAILDRSGNFYTHFHQNEKFKQYPVYRDFEALMNAFASGKASHAFVNKSIVDNHYYKGFEKLFVPVTAPTAYDLTSPIGMELRSESAFLHKILNTVLTVTSKEEIEQLIERHNKVMITYGIDKKLVVIWALVGTCVFLIALMIYFMHTDRLSRTLRRRELESKIKRTENQWLSSILDNVPNLIVITDKSNQQVLANQRYLSVMERCTKYGTASVDEKQLFLKTVKFDKASSLEHESKHLKLDDHMYRVHQQTIKHPSDGNEYQMTVFDDISVLKRKEAELEQAIASRNHFLAVVSHELRTPIAAMLGLMELLEEDLTKPESKELLRNAMLSADRLKLHVNDILDFSKIEANQLQLDICNGNLYSELGPILRSFEKNAEQKGLRFIVDWPPNAFADVDLDWLRINQILNNLLSNALKFTHEGSVEVSIASSESQLVMGISDTGCGMTPEQVSSLYLPFIQGDETITRRFGGTGLGMSIVKSLVDLMAGSISVSSQPNIGTSVIISIPMVGRQIQLLNTGPVACNNSQTEAWLNCWEVPVDEFGLYASALEPESGSSNFYPDTLYHALLNRTSKQGQDKPQQSLSVSGHVMVVDDDPINRLLFKKQLDSIGVSATVMSSGESAFKTLVESIEKEELAYDLIITDCHMPHMDGYQLTQKIKNHPMLNALPIVGCTADNAKYVLEKASAAGMNEVIFKPYSIETLRGIFERYLPPSSVNQNRCWLDSYHVDEQVEIAEVVLMAFASDKALLNSAEEPLKSVAHRIKGSAAALSIGELEQAAKTCEQWIGSDKEQVSKDALIKILEEILSSTKAWLDNRA